VVDSWPRGGYEAFVSPIYAPSSAPQELGHHPRRGELRVDVLLGEDERLAMLRAEARRGLTAVPKHLPP
jgi:hypothetical protein